ncbi:MAG: 2-oxo-4-hydroxy-4-carboxy-5-ureidoimidazoline decarboxylase [Ignavibacteriae bacterium]|nr:2-oxo-4-hydroxy-4-carboxy-5-ureidoimidazoline decarboxylase [Ignavibacteria bacterium]MBI3363451.1 2-oxo-4-hydroxy-4-carboxy-5-ureidoimidazoline decarboxylase [Ignavibacteriota bacterium]
MTLDEFNALSLNDAHEELLRCCGSFRWALQMTERRPFKNVENLFAAADTIWNTLSERDWKEAFSHHPKIGDIKSLRKKFATTAQWAEGEQAGVVQTSEKTLKALAEGNNLYEAKFGYIFIVCATGKSAEEMLALLNARLHHYPAEEIRIAAEEQRKITRIRLEKLILQIPGIHQ